MTPAAIPRATAIEVLYFDGCPNYEALVAHLRELLDHAGVEAEIELRRIESEEEAPPDTMILAALGVQAQIILAVRQRHTLAAWASGASAVRSPRG